MLFSIFYIFPAPPDISVEKTWIHASDGCDIELGCTLHGDVNSEVGFPSFFYYKDNVLDILLLKHFFCYHPCFLCC